jgi:2-amino-4-hydroxy-6-hydroxymethyldihydropteridine diphosphokinase
VTVAYVGLGANLGERERTLRTAVDRLGEDPEIDVLAVSRFRETAPVGFEDQPPFINAAVQVRTPLTARELLDRLLAVERALGRTREGPRFGPRTVDLDLLVFGDAVIDEPGLTVPHPRLAERVFALEPLADLDPHLVVPGCGRVDSLLAPLQ